MPAHVLTVSDMDEAELAVAHKAYRAADPFPHAVFDDVIAGSGRDLIEAWPSADWPGWQRFVDEYQPTKAYCDHIEEIPTPLRGILDELASPRFLRWLERLTGISKLLPDPYLNGGGLHMSSEGGFLTPHTDFHVNHELDLYRRVNVLVYLNEEWQEDWGGCLEFYKSARSKVPGRVIVPRWGTMVVFTTDDGAMHGFPKPIAGPHPRRSIATFYYTAAETRQYSGGITSNWRDDGVDGSVVRRVRARVYRSLIFISRAVAFVAHRVNPKI